MMEETVIGEITEAANEIVTEKRDTHGDAYDNHRQIAALWSAFLEREVEPWEVAIMMTMVKASRMHAGSLDRDHFVDIAGYADVAWDSAVRHPTTEVDGGDDGVCERCDGSGAIPCLVDGVRKMVRCPDCGGD